MPERELLAVLDKLGPKMMEAIQRLEERGANGNRVQTLKDAMVVIAEEYLERGGDVSPESG